MILQTPIIPTDNIWTAVITAIVLVAGYWINSVVKTSREGRTKVDLAKVGADKQNIEELKKQLLEAVDRMDQLNEELDETRKKLDSVRVAFSVIYGTLEKILKNSENPDSVEMLAKIKELVDE